MRHIYWILLFYSQGESFGVFQVLTQILCLIYFLYLLKIFYIFFVCVLKYTIDNSSEKHIIHFYGFTCSFFKVFFYIRQWKKEFRWFCIKKSSAFVFSLKSRHFLKKNRKIIVLLSFACLNFKDDLEIFWKNSQIQDLRNPLIFNSIYKFFTDSETTDIILSHTLWNLIIIQQRFLEFK